MLKKEEILPIVLGASLVTCIVICSFKYGNYLGKRRSNIEFNNQAKELYGEIASLELTIHDQKIAISDLKDMLKK